MTVKLISLKSRKKLIVGFAILKRKRIVMVDFVKMTCKRSRKYPVIFCLTGQRRKMMLMVDFSRIAKID